MNTTNSGSSLLIKIEELLNQWMLKLFPVWYLSQAAQALKLSPLGRLNPPSFLAHRWLSIQSVNKAIAQALEQEEEQWHPLATLLNKLIVHKEVTRSFNIMSIRGVEQSKHTDEWPSLIAYANEASDLAEEITSAEDFERKVNEAFPDQNRPHLIVYREWDGRSYWINKEEPELLAQLQRYGQNNQRDAQVYAKISIESLNTQILDRMRHNWWLLVFTRKDIEPFVQLMQSVNLPVVLTNFEWRRDDLAVLVAPKSNRKINQILLSVIHKRSTQEVLEFGGYISRKHHPLTKPKKGG